MAARSWCCILNLREDVLQKPLVCLDYALDETIGKSELSDVIERYIKGRNLTSTQRQQLVTVMAEIEEKCIGNLLGRQQNAIRTAVSERDMMALEAARTRLLSDELPSRLGYDYGTNPDGSKRTAPLPLPDQPLEPQSKPSES